MSKFEETNSRIILILCDSQTIGEGMSWNGERKEEGEV